MKIEKFRKALALAFADPEDTNKTRRVLSMLGYALAKEPLEQRLVTGEMLSILSIEVVSRMMSCANEEDMRLSCDLTAAMLVVHAYAAGTAPLAKGALASAIDAAEKSEKGVRPLFELIGRSLGSETQAQNRQIASMRAFLAGSAARLEKGSKRARAVASMILAALEVITAFETDVKQKFCANCGTRMRLYWVVKPKPYEDEDGNTVRPHMHYKVCGACKDDEDILEKFLLDSDQPRSFR